MENMEKVKDEAYKAAKEILEKAKLEKGDLFVVGCSTSEVCGETIGTHSKPELADMVFGGIFGIQPYLLDDCVNRFFTISLLQHFDCLF